MEPDDLPPNSKGRCGIDVNNRLVSTTKAQFFRFELDNGDDHHRKVALQEIARICRIGGQFSPSDRRGLELTVNGLLAAERDPKVIRWCLNCIARLGRREDSLNSVERALIRYADTPEIIAAAVAAIAHLFMGRLDECDVLGSVQPEIKILAALQVVPPSMLNLSQFQINVDTADKEVLKLALITVGLDRAIENLFHPRHSNAELVRVLGQHDDLIVRQYCVWSIIENKYLGMGNLGVPLDALEVEAPNVQSKILELVAREMENSAKTIDIIQRGALLPNVIAREGLAKGLRYRFIEDLQDLVVSWFDLESSSTIRELLAEHFARFGAECSQYKRRAMEIFESGERLRRQLYLGSEGTRLFGEMKALEREGGTGDLFSMEQIPLIEKLREQDGLQEVRVLMMAVMPEGSEPLRLDQEVRDVKEEIARTPKLGRKLEIIQAMAVRTTDIQRQLLDNGPQIVHFSGTGGPECCISRIKTGHRSR